MSLRSAASDEGNRGEHRDEGGDRRTRRPSLALVGLVVIGILLWLDVSTPLAAVLLAIAVCLAALSPVAAVAAVIVALPLTFQTVRLAGGSFSPLELAVVVAVIGASIALAASLVRTGEIGQLLRVCRPLPVTAAAVAVVVAACASLGTVAGTRYFDESLRVFRWTIVEPVAFWVVCRWALASDADRRFVAGAFMVVGGVTGAAAVGETLFGSNVPTAGSVARPVVTYPHPNNLAFMLERAAVFSLGLLLFSRPRPGAIAGVGLTMVGVLSTFSRGAYVAVAVGTMTLLLRRGIRRGRLAIAGLLAIGMTFVLLAAGRLLEARGSGTLPTRIPIWRSSVRMILDHPLTGVGLDQFLYEYWRRYVEPVGWPERYTSHPHNLVLDVWLRLGILGLIAFAALVVAVIVAAHRERHRRSTGGVEPAAHAALVTGLVHGLVDNGYFLPDLALLTWLLIALGTGQAAGATAPGRGAPRDQRMDLTIKAEPTAPAGNRRLEVGSL